MRTLLSHTNPWKLLPRLLCATLLITLGALDTAFSQSVGKISGSVVDSQTKEPVPLVNERMQPGSYSVNFNATGLSSGMYIYRVTTQGRVMSKPIKHIVV